MSNDHTHQEEEAKTLFGFWVYIMSDCILFAALFATFAVLTDSTYGSILSLKEIVSMPYVLTETMLLLTSSFTFGLSTLSMKSNNKKAALWFLSITFALGFAFICMEVNEFYHLIHEGFTPQKNGGFSAFFTLVGTHGLHVAAGLIWMLVLATQIVVRGISPKILGKMQTLGLFWHFLDIIWIFVFTIVYLMGTI